MKAKIEVYLRYGGMKFSYEIEAADEDSLGVKAREHCGAIFADGYRHNTGKGEFEWFGPHWIDKIKVKGLIPTCYPDTCCGT